jgi:hypothetical protein
MTALGDCLHAALAVVEDRQTRYGDPRVVMRDIASAWSLVLGITVTPAQVAQCMVMLKMIRQTHGNDPDNWTDTAGYADLGHMLSGDA